MTHSEYREYFEKLAECHVDIAHTERDPRFFTYLSQSLSDYAAKVDYGSNCMMISPFGGQFSDNGAGYRSDTRAGAFTIYHKLAGQYPDAEEIERAYDIAFCIGRDIIAMIKQKSIEGCSTIKALDLNRVSYRQLPTDSWPQFYGYAFSLPIKINSEIVVNPEKWQR